MPILPPFPFRRKTPEFHRMSCPKCGFSGLYELKKDCTIYNNPDCDNSDNPKLVEELPKVCPECGAKLKKQTIPIRIFY